MYKVKLFQGLTRNVEKDMNQWLGENVNIKIKKVSHRYDGSTCIMILYVQKEGDE